MSVSIDTPAHAPLGVVETPIRGQDALQVVGAPLLLQGKLLQASMSAGCYSGRVITCQRLFIQIIRVI